MMKSTNMKNDYRDLKDELGRRVVVSPIDGIVKKVWVHTIGGVVQPGMDLAEVVPSNETLVVEAEFTRF